jgi:hypothetical protein
MMNVRNFLIAIVTITGSLLRLDSLICLMQNSDQIGLKTAAQLISDNDKPLAYGYVHDRDVLMGKTTWEIIDLSEKLILLCIFLLIPLTLVLTEDRCDVLTRAMKNGKITEVYTDSYFNTKNLLKIFRLHSIDTTDAGREQINAGNKISDEYETRFVCTRRNNTRLKDIGILISVKVN